MHNALRIVIVVVSLPVVAIGVRAMLDPVRLGEQVSLAAAGPPGLAALRGGFGALLMGVGLIMLMGVWRKNTTWFLAGGLLSSLVVVGRSISLVADGFEPALLVPIALNVVVVGLALAAHKTSGGAPNPS